MIADIKKQEDKNHFVAQLAIKYGLPAWNRSVSNTSVRNANARSATGDSLQLFLIPFRAADSSVSSYLMCARNGDEFTYRYYKKNTIDHLYAANDTIKQLREGLLSVFGFFEKGINNKDSISIGGIYNEKFKEVSIKINGNQINTNLRSTDIGLSLLEVCYSVSGGGGGTGPQMRSSSHDGVHCITVGVYGSLIDLGFASSNGYSSGGGGGSGGGGSTGSSSFPDGFVCPQSEWWCESGDFRFVDGVLYTPESFPGVEVGYPWLWWENDSWLSNPNNFNLDIDVIGNQYNELTAAEKILVNRYPLQALRIKKNATKAILETSSRFPNNSQLNDKADAFRHAFFNAMNERDCRENSNGESIAYLFGVAHESEVPTVLHLEKEMDLFNNSVGINVGYSYWFPSFVSDSQVSDDIYQKLLNGELKYLKPLNFSTSPLYDVNHDHIQDCPTCLNGIISTTALVWSNQ